jgi:uncharacterized protein (DUF1499 family)
VKITLISLSLFILAFLALFFILGVMSKSGKAPGLIDGRLSPCPDKPNCVCSEHKDDAGHYVEPVIIPENNTLDTLPVLKNVIQGMGGSIQAESDNYLAATFSSAIFGFVDDLEIRIDTDQEVLHMRSASRVGHGDMGVNRHRTELLGKLYLQELADARLPPAATH